MFSVITNIKTSNWQSNSLLAAESWQEIGEEILVHWRPSFIALHVVNDLETCRPYGLIINLEVIKFVKKTSSSGFFITFVGVDQIIKKMAMRPPERTFIKSHFLAISMPSLFYTQFQMKSNYYKMKQHSQNASCS